MVTLDSQYRTTETYIDPPTHKQCIKCGQWLPNSMKHTTEICEQLQEDQCLL